MPDLKSSRWSEPTLRPSCMKTRTNTIPRMPFPGSWEDISSCVYVILALLRQVLTWLQCLRAIFAGPRMAMNLSTHQDRPSRHSVAELSDINKVTVPVIVYVALVVGVFIVLSPCILTSIGTTFTEFSELLEWYRRDVRLPRVRRSHLQNFQAWRRVDKPNDSGMEHVSVYH